MRIVFTIDNAEEELIHIVASAIVEAQKRLEKETLDKEIRRSLPLGHPGKTAPKSKPSLF